MGEGEKTVARTEGQLGWGGIERRGKDKSGPVQTLGCSPYHLGGPLSLWILLFPDFIPNLWVTGASPRCPLGWCSGIWKTTPLS